MPLAPGRFSTITCWPRRSDIFGAMRRDMMSVVLPGGNGMMMRIGRDGYEEDEGCACVTAANNQPKINKSRRDFIVLLRKTWSVPDLVLAAFVERRGQPSHDGGGHHRPQHGFPPLRDDRQEQVRLTGKM